jgi:membrane-bound lytic murein transglycosylase D
MRNVTNLVISLMVLITCHVASAENFPKPAELRPDIDFWKRIYTEVDTSTGFIHDSYNLAVVYETVKINTNGSVSINDSNRRKAHYKNILIKLATGERKGLNAEEKRVLALWGEDITNKRLKQAAGNIRFQRGQADRFREGVIRSGEWRSYINQVMRSMNMPVELAILPHVESSFNPEAYSKVGAAGMWQFIRSTGKRYLQIDHVVDERMDPFAATVAAAKLLKHNYSITQSWPLALTAYNHGLASMRRAINSLNTRDIAIIAREYKGRSFGFASRNFYLAFVAALEVDQNPQKYFGTLALAKPYQYEVVTMNDYVFASAVSKALGVNEQVLQRHNRSLLASVWNGAKRIPKGYQLRIPKKHLNQSAKILLASIPVSQRYNRQTQDTYHVVSRGDTMSGIAKHYGHSVRDLMLSNGMTNRNLIRIGQKLRLPVDGKNAVVVAQVDEKSLLPSATTLKPAVGIAAMPEPEVKEEAEKVAKIEQNKQAVIVEEHEIGADLLPAEQVAETETVAESALVTDTQANLLSDPNDYTVAKDKTIEVQASETLGHYAEWLDIRASQLRKLNNMHFGKHVVIGKRLKLDFSRVDPELFEQRRVAYQNDLQENFFAEFRIQSTYEYRLKHGDSLWVLALQKFKVPLWLIRQHNPDINFDRIAPGEVIVVPKLIKVVTATDKVLG